MSDERDIRTKLVYEIDGLQVYRTEAKKYDETTDKCYGHTVVYYDVYDGEYMICSYKTLREAQSFCKRLSENGVATI